MGRAYPSASAQDYGSDAGEWQSLRGELVALLDQVESQVARTRQDDQGYQSIAERMRLLRDQVAEPEPESRHREALRSVKRAVDRFSERDEAYATNPRDTLQSAIQQIRARHPEPQSPPPQPGPRSMDSPRFDDLAHAVGGISGRLERLEAELRMSAKSQTGNVKEIAEQVAQLSHVVELLAGAVGETGQVKRLEAQIAGLAKLVADGSQNDLGTLTQRLDQLSGTISKLMERQDSSAGSLRAQSDGVAQRLDDVTATMGRLADLQVQFANRVEGSAKATYGVREGIVSIEAGLKDGMQAIESSVRNVYDRIDALERGSSLSQTEVDRLTDEMARFTEAMRNPAQPQNLIEAIEGLNERIRAMESTDRNVAGLKADVGALHSAVAEAIEPRFAALEMQLEALNERMIERAGDRPADDISVGQLEAQVRQLVARMDQTGEQLSGLAKLYVQPGATPDYETIADMLAERTSQAMAEHRAPLPPAPLDSSGMDEIERRVQRLIDAQPAPAPSPGLDARDIDEIERRVSRLLETAQRERPSEDTTAIEGSIAEVSSRLARLEKTLSERGRESATPAAQQPIVTPASYVASAPIAREPDAEPTDETDPIAPLLAGAAQLAMHEARGEESATLRAKGAGAPPPRSDVMPANPGAEAPLTDKPFGDGSTLKAALEAKNGPRKQHPGLSYEPLPGQGSELSAENGARTVHTSTVRPSFDPASVDRPPRPISSFDMPDRELFAEPRQAGAPAGEADDESPSTNTFIAAARRAAQRQQLSGKAAASGGGGSLIARALATFQQSGAAKAEPAPPPPAKPPKAAKPDKPVKESRRDKKARQLAGDKDPRTSWAAENEPKVAAPVSPPKAAIKTSMPLPPDRPAGPHAPEPVALDQEAPGSKPGKKDGFLSRFRRPILLAASVVAIAFLTFNLISQRMSEAEPAPAAVSANVSDVEPAAVSPLIAEPVATIPAMVSGPRVIPIVDSLATASIDPAAAQGFSPSSQSPQMPAAFEAIASATEGASAILPEGETVDVAALTDDAVTADLPAVISSPVQVEMPPEALGPEPLRLAAANGDARAQFEIAAIYTEGRAVPEDLGAAAVWYERAAAQGFAPAQYRLGNLYENGRGVTRDLQQAKLWYQRSAEAGNRMAMHNLAALYASGELGKQEFDAAAGWFEQAALRGMRDSQFNLGMLYARGLGVTQSLEESYRWFSLAAARGDTDAAKARDDVARSLDAETVSRLNGDLGAFKNAAIDLVANFAPIGTWLEGFDPGAPITVPEVVKSVQAALNALGYDVGTPDGIAGPKTADAIRTFERTTGMSESGQINPRLLAVLGSQPV